MTFLLEVAHGRITSCTTENPGSRMGKSGATSTALQLPEHLAIFFEYLLYSSHRHDRSDYGVLVVARQVRTGKIDTRKYQPWIW